MSCQQKASHRHPLSAGSEEGWSSQWSPSPLGQHLSSVENMPTGPQCSPGHGTRVMVPGQILTQGAQCGKHGPGPGSDTHSQNIS